MALVQIKKVGELTDQEILEQYALIKNEELKLPKTTRRKVNFFCFINF
jgi:hypothetical protein